MSKVRVDAHYRKVPGRKSKVRVGGYMRKK